MKNTVKKILCGLLVLSLLCAAVGCAEKEEESESKFVGVVENAEDITANSALDGAMDEGMVSEGRLYFMNGGSKTEALLVEENTLTWLYCEDKSIFASFDTGDFVRVGHGMIMETYPGQTYITRIALIEDGDINSFTDGEWNRLSDVFSDGPER